MRRSQVSGILFLALAALSPKSASAQEPVAELDQVLSEWCFASAKSQRLACEFTRFKCFPTSAGEIRAHGSLMLERGPLIVYRKPYIARLSEAYYRSPTHIARYLLRADGGQASEGIVEQPFRTDLGHWAGEAVAVSKRGRPSFAVGAVDIRDFSLIKPFLLGILPTTVKSSFTVTIVNCGADEVRLKLVPHRRCEFRQYGYDAEYDHAELILDRQTWLLKAIKVCEVSGVETVHVFRSMAVNSWHSWFVLLTNDDDSE
jgi:hypothetical protein